MSEHFGTPLLNHSVPRIAKESN